MIQVAPRLAQALRGQIARGALGTLGLKVAGTGLGLLLNLALARLLGVAGYGAFAFAMAVLRILVIPAAAGFDKLLIREVAALSANARAAEIPTWLRVGDHVVLLVATALAGVTLLLLAVVSGLDPALRATTMVAALALPFGALAALREATIKGLRRVVLAQTPNFVFRPLLILLLVVTVAFITEGQLSATAAVWCYVATTCAALVILHGLRARLLAPLRQSSPAAPRLRYLAAARTALPFALHGALSVFAANLVFLLLGGIVSSAETGLFQVAFLCANVISFPIFALSAPLSPAFAGLYRIGNHAAVKRKAVLSARYSTAAALAITAVYAVAGPALLGLFGSEFVAAYPALLILAAAWVIKAALGQTAALLLMIGFEHDSVAAAGIAMLVVAAAGLALIPAFGALGAAIAFSLGSLAMDVFLVRRVSQRCGMFIGASARLAR